MAPSIPKPPERRPCRQPGAGLLGTEILHLATVTPLFGGGPRARTADRHTPIRVPGIRGQLRFWWRALFAPDTPEELAERERALFGGVFGNTVVRSSVDVWISDQTPNADKPISIDTKTRAAYAVWPARPETRQQRLPGEGWAPGVRFRLHVRAPEEMLEREIVPALRAWLWFGGVGGRTRRGCGSLTVLADQARWLPRAFTWDELDRLLGNRGALDPRSRRTPNEMPSLHGAALFCGRKNRAFDAWTEALAWLKDFRQGARSSKEAARPAEEFARHKVQKHPRDRPGQSNWPEPDKIRQLCDPGVEPWSHAPEHNADPAWPRAGFGLPIIGFFQRESEDHQPYNEPDDFELRWKDRTGPHDRLASPLIVKAMPLADGRTFASIALWLHRAYPQDGQVFLSVGKRKKVFVQGSEAPFDKLVGKGETPQYAALRGKGTLEQAFCDWLVKKGARAVKPGSKR